MLIKSLSILGITTTISLTGLVAYAGNDYYDPISQSNQIITQNPNPSENQSQPNRNQRRSVQLDLNLTPEQKQKIQQIRAQNYDQIAKTQQELQQAREKLRTMFAGSDSTTAIRAQHNQVLLLTEKLANLNLESLLQIREVLDSSQRMKFAESMQADNGNQSDNFFGF